MVFVFWDTFEIYIAIKKLRTRVHPQKKLLGWEAPSVAFFGPSVPPPFEEMSELGLKRFRN